MNDFTPAPQGTLAADLENLAAAGTAYVPELAAHYAKANRQVAGCEVGDGLAGRPVSGPLEAARDSAQNMLYRMATTLEDVGEALCRVARHYASRDTELSHHLAAYLDFRASHHDADVPPPDPDIPEAKVAGR